MMEVKMSSNLRERLLSKVDGALQLMSDKKSIEEKKNHQLLQDVKRMVTSGRWERKTIRRKFEDEIVYTVAK